MLRLSRIVCLLGVAVPAIGSLSTSSAVLVDPCLSTVTANSGIVLVCPFGDGDPLSSVGSAITVTVRQNGGALIPGIPPTDMWLVGCNEGLWLCGGSAGSSADAATNASGQATFSNEPIAGGCDTGLYVSVQGIFIQQAGTCLPLCLPIALRSPDFKSAGAPGPAPCAGDISCPDYRVTDADYSWFVAHYSTAGNPGPYHPCADFAAPFGQIGLGDFSKFVEHFATGHQCVI